MQLGRGLTMLGNHSRQRTWNNKTTNSTLPRVYINSFFAPFRFLSYRVCFFCGTTKERILTQMFKFWNDLYRAETHLKSTKKGATSTFNPSINQLSFSWSILNICKGSYHGIELNWRYLGFWASLYSGSSQCLLTVRVLTKGSHSDSHSKLWITSKRVFGTILLFLLLCFVVMTVSFIFASSNEKNKLQFYADKLCAGPNVNSADMRLARTYWSLRTR